MDFEALHEDLKTAILSRLSLKSVGKCICASKKLGSIICTKHFRDSYLHQSMTRPRMLFMILLALPLDSKPTEDLLFYSVYQEEKPLLLSGQQESRIFQCPLGCKSSQSIRGLICIRDVTKIRICNPTTKKCRTLLEMKPSREKNLIAHYFGHDEKDAFKVLCVMKMKSDGQSEECNEYQVLTVGSTEESWKKITCEHDYSPLSQGLCKGGVLYYVAWSNSAKSLVMMSFNVSKETFDGIALPKEVAYGPCWKLVNYKGDIALVNDFDSEFCKNGVLKIWVWKEIEKKWEWKETCIVIPQDRWKEIDDFERYTFRFKGTIGTGELVFALDFLDNMYPSSYRGCGRILVLCYDTVTEILKRYQTEKEFQGYYVQTMLDHVESFELCED